MGGPGSGRKKGGSRKSMSRRDPGTAAKIRTGLAGDRAVARAKKNPWAATSAGRGYKLPKGYKQRPQ